MSIQVIKNSSPWNVVSEGFGKGLKTGLQQYFANQQEEMMTQKQAQRQQQQAQQEGSTLQSVLEQAGNDPQSKFRAILTSPLSNETKRLAISSITAQQKGQPTPYQEELLNQRKSHLDIQQKRIDQAKEKGRKELPKMISGYTKDYVKDLGIDPEDKLELDNLVQDAYTNQNMDLNEALESGLNIIERRRDAIDSARVPPRPFASDLRAEAKTNAMEQTASILQQLYDSGVTKPRDLRAIAQRGGWQKEEVDEILERVSGGKIKKRPGMKSITSLAPSASAKVKFDSKNPEHIARAKEVLSKAGGDKAKAKALLAEEFSK